MSKLILFCALHCTLLTVTQIVITFYSLSVYLYYEPNINMSFSVSPWQMCCSLCASGWRGSHNHHRSRETLQTSSEKWYEAFALSHIHTPLTVTHAVVFSVAFTAGKDTNLVVYIKRRLAMCARKLGRIKEAVKMMRDVSVTYDTDNIQILWLYKVYNHHSSA